MRWKFFVPFIVIVGAITVFNIVFLDVLLKKALVASGEAIFGAKVEVRRLKTKFSDLSITINALAVADKNDVWKNVFEVEKIRFAVRPLPLLSAKFNIDEISVEGMRFGTPRKTSGALPPRKIKKIKKREADSEDGFFARLTKSLYEKGKSQVMSLPAVENIREARQGLHRISSVVKIDELESPKEIENLRMEISEKYSRNEKLIKNLQVNERLEPLSAAVFEASKIRLSSVEDVKAAAPTLEKLKSASSGATKLLADVSSVKNQISDDFGSSAEILKRLDEVKKRDIERISQKLKLPELPKANIAEALFGKVWTDRFYKAVYYVGLVRKYIPARKGAQDKKIVVRRLKGRDIYFPHPAAPPKFLIKKISISGIAGEISFQGLVKDITNEPARLGRPTIIDIGGQAGNRSLRVEAVLDHTTDIPKDIISIAYKGLEGSALGISDINSDYLPSFDKSYADILAEGSFIGEDINCRVSIITKGIEVKKFPPEDKDEIKSLIARIWEGINSINVTAALTARKGEELKFNVSSDVDKILFERIKNMFGEKLAEARKKIEAEISKVVDEKRQEALKEFESKKKAINEEISAKENEVRAQEQAIRAKLEEIENKIKEIEEREKNRLSELKKKAEEELKKRSGEKLDDLKKNLFK